MTTNSPKVLFLIMMLIPASFSPAFAQTVSYDVTDLFIKIELAPPHIDQKNSILPIGYVNVVNKGGSAVQAPQDIAVGLESDDPEIASVPASVVIPKGQNYAIFNVEIGDVDGETTISSVFNDVIDFEEIQVGGNDSSLPDDIELIVNLPTKNMHVNSEMPFSIFLQTSQGEVIRAPFDIEIQLDYEESLLQPNQDSLIIKKGEYYSWGVLTTSQEVGNSFIRATFGLFGIDTAENIEITSSLPVALSLHIFPEQVSADVERFVDVFVGLVDSEGLPSVTPEDVQLELFSDKDSIGSKLDDRMQQDDVIIKKGEFGYHFREKVDLSNYLEQSITIGASAEDLGIALDDFEAVESLNFDNEFAENKTLSIFALPQIPSNTTSILIYQISAKGNLDPGTVEECEEEECEVVENEEQHPIEVLQNTQVYPVQANENYKAEGIVDKINIISSDNSIIQVEDPGNIESARSYGTAILSSGQEVGDVTLAATLKGVGAGTITTEIVDIFKHVNTKIFSPTGAGTIVVDKNGYFDLFLIALDGKQRPKILEENTKYILSPVNEIIEIKKNRAFANANFHSDSFSAGTEDSIVVDAIPIGINADLDLEASYTFSNQVSSIVKVVLPFENLDSKAQSEYLGVVQLTDLLDNPSPASKDVRIKLNIEGAEIVSIPEHITISQDSSYATFPIIPNGQKGESEIVVSVKGVVGSDTKISTTSNEPKLKIFADGIDNALQVDTPVSLTVFVDDENAESVSGASVKFETNSGATVSPSITRTAEDGSAKVELTAHKGEPISLQIFASAAGYIDGEQSFDYQVEGGASNSIALGLPEWVIYVGLAAVIGIIAVLVIFLKKPKPEYDEDEEYEYEEEI